MNANGRRYRQAINKFSHLAKRQRPNYRMRDAEASRRHLAAVVEKENRIRMNAKKKAKK